MINAEAFTAGPEMSLWNETPESVKPIGDAAYCDGVNRLMLHRFTHEPWNDRYKPGVVMGQWGTHFDRTQTWWEPGKAWVQYMQRCQALLQWGTYRHRARRPATQMSAAGRKSRAFTAPTAQSTSSSWRTWPARPAPQNARSPVSGKQPELWDPVTAAIRDLPEFEVKDGRTMIPLRFDAAQSCFIVFRKELPATASRATTAGQKNFPKCRAIAELAGPWQVSFDANWGGPENTGHLRRAGRLDETPGAGHQVLQRHGRLPQDVRR